VNTDKDKNDKKIVKINPKVGVYGDDFDSVLLKDRKKSTAKRVSESS
jgi:hypothetical protein